ncbi:MAG: DUF6544 family protein [Solirubrobacteraceae bacterium]
MSARPEIVQRYLQGVLPDGPGEGRVVRITQSGEMTLKPGEAPRRFEATEELRTDRVAFAWRAAFPIFGPVSLRVLDRYDAGEALLEVRALGLPLQRRRGAELARGEAIRYLAEIAWAPQAILANSELSFSELDDGWVKLETSVGGERVAVRLLIDEAGKIVRTIAERPRAEAGNAVTRWIGEYAEYRAFGNVLVPTRAEVSWELQDGPFTYWRAAITSVKLCDRAAA